MRAYVELALCHSGMKVIPVTMLLVPSLMQKLHLDLRSAAELETS